MTVEPGDLLDPPYDWLPEVALLRLGRRVDRLISSGGWPFDGFTPDDYLEGELSEAILQTFVAEGPPVVVEAYAGDEDGGSATFDVVAVIEGHGDAHWHSSQLTGTDLETFGGRVEAPDAGGLLYDVDLASPCQIAVAAQFVVRGKTWSDVVIDRVTLTEAETQRRKRHHDDIEFRRMQNSGLYPPDEEL
jgi:hypothetical protein